MSKKLDWEKVQDQEIVRTHGYERIDFNLPRVGSWQDQARYFKKPEKVAKASPRASLTPEQQKRAVIKRRRKILKGLISIPGSKRWDAGAPEYRSNIINIIKNVMRKLEQADPDSQSLSEVVEARKLIELHTINPENG